MRSTLSFLLATVLLTSVSTATPAFGPSFALSSRRLANQGALLNNREASFEKRQLDLGRLTGLAMGSNNPAPAPEAASAPATPNSPSPVVVPSASTPDATTTSTPAAAAAPTFPGAALFAVPQPASPSSASSSSSSPSTDKPVDGPFTGRGTYFYQDGVNGACGKLHTDNDFVVALQIDRYGNGSNNAPACGRTMKITNQENGKSVNAVVADACMGCASYNSIDLSVAAFKSIASQDEGDISVSWVYIS